MIVIELNEVQKSTLHFWKINLFLTYERMKLARGALKNITVSTCKRKKFLKSPPQKAPLMNE